MNPHEGNISRRKLVNLKLRKKKINQIIQNEEQKNDENTNLNQLLKILKENNEKFKEISKEMQPIVNTQTNSSNLKYNQNLNEKYIENKYNNININNPYDNNHKTQFNKISDLNNESNMDNNIYPYINKGSQIVEITNENDNNKKLNQKSNIILQNNHNFNNNYFDLNLINSINNNEIKPNQINFLNNDFNQNFNDGLNQNNVNKNDSNLKENIYPEGNIKQKLPNSNSHINIEIDENNLFNNEINQKENINEFNDTKINLKSNLNQNNLINNEILKSNLNKDNEINLQSNPNQNDLINNEILKSNLNQNNEINLPNLNQNNEILKSNLNQNNEILKSNLNQNNEINLQSNLNQNDLINLQSNPNQNDLINLQSNLNHNNEINLQSNLNQNDLINNEILKSNLNQNNEILKSNLNQNNNIINQNIHSNSVQNNLLNNNINLNIETNLNKNNNNLINQNLRYNSVENNLLNNDINLNFENVLNKNDNNNLINPILKSNSTQNNILNNETSKKSHLNEELNQDIKIEQKENNLLNNNDNLNPDNQINLNDYPIFQNNIPNITNTNENQDKKINQSIDINQNNMNNNINNDINRKSLEYFDKCSQNENNGFDFNNNFSSENNNNIRNHFLPEAKHENNDSNNQNNSLLKVQNEIYIQNDINDQFNILPQDDNNLNNEEKKNPNQNSGNLLFDFEENNNIKKNIINNSKNDNNNIEENDENNNFRPSNNNINLLNNKEESKNEIQNNYIRSANNISNELNENKIISNESNLNQNNNIEQNNNEDLNNNIISSNNNIENSKNDMNLNIDNIQNNIQNENNIENENDQNILKKSNKSDENNIDFKIDDIDNDEEEKKSFNEKDDINKQESIHLDLGEENNQINTNILPPSDNNKIENKNEWGVEKDDNDSVINDNNRNMNTKQPKELTDEMKRDIESNKKNYNSYLSKLEPRMIEKIDEAVENVYTFDTDNPYLLNINSYFHINELEEEEKKYSDNFVDYENLMDRESHNIRKKRKEKFEILQHFSGRIDQNELLLKYISEYNPTHIDEMTRIESSIDLNVELPKINEEMRNKIFDENELLNDFNSPIGNFENTETFIYKYSVHDNYKVMGNAFKNFNYWRPSFPDGNSFYRIFMYSLFENYIISANVGELKKIICEIIKEDYITLYRNKGINIEHLLYILKEILDLVEKRNIIEAYNLFNKAYRLKSHCFDYSLIYYLRKVVYFYSNEVMKIYLKNINKNININEILNVNAIEEFGIEPEFILICFMPYLYDICLKIFWIDGDFNKPKDGIINFVDEDDDQLPILTFGMFYSNFNILYSDKINENLKKLIGQYNINITQLTYVKTDETYFCEICEKDTNHIFFLEKKFMVCQNCFTSYVNKILKKRAKNFQKDYYYGIEYYNKPIHLQNDYYIDNYDIIEIFSKNINNILHENLFSKNLNICKSCKKEINLESDNKIQMSCGCTFCNNCFKELLTNATQGKMYLNRYEKETFEKIDCKCGNKFNIDEALTLYHPSEEEINQAKKRMVQYIQSLCYGCLKELAKYNESKKSFQILEKFIKVQIKKEKKDSGYKIEYYDGQHIICNSCFKKEKSIKISDIDENDNMNENNNQIEELKENEIKISEDNNEERKDNKNDDNKRYVKINCKICNKVHTKILNGNEENNEGKCCGGCYLF